MSPGGGFRAAIALSSAYDSQARFEMIGQCPADGFARINGERDGEIERTTVFLNTVENMRIAWCDIEPPKRLCHSIRCDSLSGGHYSNLFPFLVNWRPLGGALPPNGRHSSAALKTCNQQ